MFGGSLWLIATARNALLVFFTSFLAYFAAKQGKTPFVLTGTVRSGLPDIALPPFSTFRAGPNDTLVEMGFQEMVSVSTLLRYVSIKFRYLFLMLPRSLNWVLR